MASLSSSSRIRIASHCGKETALQSEKGVQRLQQQQQHQQKKMKIVFDLLIKLITLITKKKESKTLVLCIFLLG